MKKIAVGLALAAALLPAAGRASEWTIKAGLNLSRLMASVPDSRLTGFSAGASAAFRLWGPLSIQPEVYFVRRGHGQAFPVSVPGLSSRIVLDYVEAPILLKWTILRPGRFRVAALGGGYAAFNVRAAAHSEYGGEVLDEDLGSEVEKTDFGAVAGLSLETSWGRALLVLDVRASWGLKAVNRFLGADPWRNSCLSLMLGAGF